MSAGLAVAQAIAPDERWVGNYFPNDCTGQKASWESFDPAYPLKTRYLPTTTALAAVRRRFGPAAEPALRAWRELWRAAVGDVDAFAAKIKLKVDGPETEAEAEPAKDWPGPAFCRPASFHVLEDAVAHVEAVRAGFPFVLQVKGEKETVRFARVPGKRRLARLSGHPDLRRIFPREDRMTPYWALQAFRDRAGRGMAVAANADQLVNVLLDMSAQGHDKAFLKLTLSKGGTWVQPIPRGGPDTVRRALRETLGQYWTKFEDGSWRMSYLVQGMVPFVREHRFFVVSHRVVASTASDRLLGALDAPVTILDERVAALDLPASAPGFYDRGSARHPVDRALAARMAWGARDLARAMAGSGIPIDCYVIDMGQAPDGRVLPIEVNCFSQSGAYALSVHRVMDSLRRRADRLGAARIETVGAGRPRRGPMGNEEIERHAAQGTRDLLASGEFGEIPRRFLDRHARWLANLYPNADAKASDRVGYDLPAGFDPATDPRFRRRWLRFVASQTFHRFERAAHAVTRYGEGGSIGFHAHVLPMEECLAADIRSTGLGVVWDPVRRDRGKRGPDVGWRIEVSVPIDQVDWRRTLPSGDGFFDCPMHLFEDAQGVVSAIWPGRDMAGADPGLRVGDRVSLRAYERKDPVAAQVEDEESMREVLAAWQAKGRRYGWEEFLDGEKSALMRALRKAGPDPAAWEDVRAGFAARFDETAAARARARIKDMLDTVLSLDTDSLGRTTLEVEETPDGPVYSLPPYGDLVPGDHVVVDAGDIDLKATLLEHIGNPLLDPWDDDASPADPGAEPDGDPDAELDGLSESVVHRPGPRVFLKGGARIRAMRVPE